MSDIGHNVYNINEQYWFQLPHHHYNHLILLYHIISYTIVFNYRPPRARALQYAVTNKTPQPGQSI